MQIKLKALDTMTPICKENYNYHKCLHCNVLIIYYCSEFVLFLKLGITLKCLW